MTLMRFDITGLKTINDRRFGHEEGDRALPRLSDALGAPSARPTLRAVWRKRVGAFHAGRSPEHTERVLTLLKERLDELGARRRRAYELRYSVGIVELDSARHRTAEELMEEVGQTMQLAKREAPTQHTAFWQTGRRRG
ncbi:MAG: diguanylate cyclase [Bryobacterales bacterium]